VENIYTEQGYKSRTDYLKSLSEEYGVPLDVVHSLAGLLGPNEDFDGLISALEDVVIESDEFNDECECERRSKP
jgi:hypothetical protein